MRAQLVYAAAMGMAGALYGANSGSTCRDGFEVGAAGIRELALDVEPGAVRILGTKDQRVRVSCEIKGNEDPSRTKIRWSAGVNSARVTIGGGSWDGHKYRIEVPERSDLIVRVTAGDVSVRGVEGSKDVEMTAGDLKIELGRPDDYEHVEMSVRAGDLRAKAFRVRKGGLFRSFSRHYSRGKYKLHASLGAGNVTLE
ncbi:MAG: hypothetical protein ABI972_22835 [Acidobacteriota bacterium]